MLWRSEIPNNLKIDADARTDTCVGIFSCVQYIIYVKGSEGNVLGSAHAFRAYGM
jgi:hypothetical protein